MPRAVLKVGEERPHVAGLDRDRALVQAAQRDPLRFDALYRKYLAQVYNYAYYELRDHHAAEDATERTFMQAFAALPRFEDRAEGGAGAPRPSGAADVSGASGEEMPPGSGSTFRVWLFRIARNVVANERRTVRRRAGVGPLEGAGEMAAPDDVAELAAGREAASAAWQAVARLPQDRRRVVELRFVEEMSTAEIAAVLGRSEGAIRVLLHRALRSVAADLRDRLS